MRMEAEPESKKDGWPAVSTVIRTRGTVIVRSGGAVIIRWRSGVITRRWRGGRGYPIAAGAILDLGELVGASCHHRGKEEGYGGEYGDD